MQVVCLDDLVSGDDDLRRIEALVDWGQGRRTAEPFFGPAVRGAQDRSGGAGQARAGVGVAGVAVDARALRVAATDVSIRRFLGFGLTERLPDHSTFSHAQTKRFADSSVFEQLFTAVLRQWTEGGGGGGGGGVGGAPHTQGRPRVWSVRAPGSLVCAARA